MSFPSPCIFLHGTAVFLSSIVTNNSIINLKTQVMNNLDLNAYGVVELTQQEMITVEGGNLLSDTLIGIGKFLLVIGFIINIFSR